MTKHLCFLPPLLTVPISIQKLIFPLNIAKNLVVLEHLAILMTGLCVCVCMCVWQYIEEAFFCCHRSQWKEMVKMKVRVIRNVIQVIFILCLD